MFHSPCGRDPAKEVRVAGASGCGCLSSLAKGTCLVGTRRPITADAQGPAIPTSRSPLGSPSPRAALKPGRDLLGALRGYTMLLPPRLRSQVRPAPRSQGSPIVPSCHLCGTLSHTRLHLGTYLPSDPHERTCGCVRTATGCVWRAGFYGSKFSKPPSLSKSLIL